MPLSCPGHQICQLSVAGLVVTDSRGASFSPSCSAPSDLCMQHPSLKAGGEERWMSSYRTNVLWKDNPLLLPDSPRSLLVQHLVDLTEMRAKGCFALAQFPQILLCGEESCPCCCELLGSSASVGDDFKGWVCSVFKMFSCNKTLLLSVVDGKPRKQKHFLLPTSLPKFQ